MNIGIDIVYIERFTILKEKLNFMRKVFSSNELKYIESKNTNIATIAGLYATKEAFLKAIKMGINNYKLKDIEICHNNNGVPFLKLHNKAKLDFGNKSFDISISHDKDYAVSTVIVF